MKKVIFVTVALLVLGFMFTSCSTIVSTTAYSSRAEGMLPVRDITSKVDYEYSIIGSVEGTASVVYNDKGQAIESDPRSYGSLELDDIARMYYPMDKVKNDAEAVALASAVADLINNARKLGANFVSLPNYTVVHTKNTITVSVNALACRVKH